MFSVHVCKQTDFLEVQQRRDKYKQIETIDSNRITTAPKYNTLRHVLGRPTLYLLIEYKNCKDAFTCVHKIKTCSCLALQLQRGKTGKAKLANISCKFMDMEKFLVLSHWRH